MKSDSLAIANRNNGYINIDQILGLPLITSVDELVEALKNNRNISIESFTNYNNNIQLVFSFKHDEVKYFYKYDCPREPLKISPYNELIVGEIADDLSMPHVSYDLATVSGFKGFISKDFCKNNVRYISGKEFLINNHPLGKKDNIANLNNLEDIWIALEKYYDHNDNQDKVNDIMKNIVNMFIFDIITGQTDRGYCNWWLIEYPNKVLDLQPLFDNIRILTPSIHYSIITERSPQVSKILLTVNQDIIRYCEDNLEEFLRFSGQEFIETLSNSLWVISQENIEKIFTRIEKRTSHSMPEELKQFYRSEFKTQLEFINESYNKIFPSKYK